VDNLPIKDKKCIVLYNGTYIPLHGVEYLLEAAEILQKNPKANNIEFLFYGDGQQRYEMVALSEKLGLKNVRFNFDFKEAELQKYIHKSTIYLGIFGNTDKAKRVIPCKVYKGMAMHACVLTGHSIAMDELFVEGKEYLGTKFADAKDIAEKILILANNKDLRERIAAAGYLGFLKKADISSVAKEFKEVFLDLRLMVDEKNNLNNLDKKTKQKKKIKNILRNKLGYK
jgi:glycosyltransferase involved in cell wall biosynthesis